MDARRMPEVSIVIDARAYALLRRHLFPGDGDEHGAVLTAGVASGKRGPRLLVRDVFPAEDGVDYVPGQRGYRALTARFVAEKAEYCRSNDLAYLAVHCHAGTSSVSFSRTDLESHERTYPAILDITRGGPVGALVFADGAVASDIWLPDIGRTQGAHMTIIGPTIRHLYPNPQHRPSNVRAMYDRNIRLFGDVGQSRLRDLTVGIIGLGGGGSLINEWLSRLGVGHIIAVDRQRLDKTNLPRVVGSSRWDALYWLASSKSRLMQRCARRFSKHKVHIAGRVARQANPDIEFDEVVGDVLDEDVARRLTDVDFLFLATDNIASRLVFNAIVHQYLIPGFQVGVKVRKRSDSDEVGEITAVTRPVLPQLGGGCLKCQGAIPAGRVQEEALTDQEQRLQRYVDDDAIEEPSVITLNVLSAAQAVNDLLFAVVGLFNDDITLDHEIIFPRERAHLRTGARAASDCLDCGSDRNSRRARGDRARLPCRETSRRTATK